MDPWLSAPRCRCTNTARWPARAAVAVSGTDLVWPLPDLRWPMPWATWDAGGTPWPPAFSSNGNVSVPWQSKVRWCSAISSCYSISGHPTTLAGTVNCTFACSILNGCVGIHRLSIKGVLARFVVCAPAGSCWKRHLLHATVAPSTMICTCRCTARATRPHWAELAGRGIDELRLCHVDPSAGRKRRSPAAAACGLVDLSVRARGCSCTDTAMRPARTAVTVAGNGLLWPPFSRPWPMPRVLR